MSIEPKNIAFGVVGGLVVMLIPALSWAQEGVRSGGLLVSPVLFERQAAPGDNVELAIKIFNDSDEASRTLEISVQDFSADPKEGGEPLIITDPEQASAFSLKSWIQLEAGPHQVPVTSQLDLPISITVPAEAEPGSHYAMVVISESNSQQAESDQPVSVQEQVGALVLIEVAGEVDIRRELASFATDRSLYFGFPVVFETRIKNHGTVHFKPFGTIEITSKMTGKEFEVLQVNNQFGNILPDSTRKFTNEWHPEKKFIPHLGKYTGLLTLSLGDTGKTVQREISFWVLPADSLIITLIALVVLVVLLKGYNWWIIWRYRQTRK